jgi:preprotein translocase subunit SecA
VGIADRLKKSFQQLLQRPGATVNLAEYEALLDRVADRETELRELPDDELTAAARELLGRPNPEDQDAEDDDEAVSADVVDKSAGLTPDQLVEICALGREAGRRALGETAFDTQLLGAMAMIDGRVAEMATGEGKTLAAVIAAFGHAVRGARVHILTVNDYLAKRDAIWMGPVYDLLGLSVASVGESNTHDERAEAYASDVTYVAISEAGFDFLRDQLITSPGDAVMPGMDTVIIDEADSILIDEARVPLVLAGSITETDAETITVSTATLVGSLRPGRDYTVVDDRRNVQLTARGALVVERAFGDIDLYAEESLPQLTAVNQALHARALLTRDVDYIVREGKVALVDEFRGRVPKRRRWPDGLQAAVEAKEGLVETPEGHVLGSITVQAFIGLYQTVCGMTGTAIRIGDQLREFYELEVAVIPPNTPNIRVDEPDRVYATAEEKELALIAEVTEAHALGRPVLVGTLDVAESERLAEHMRAAGIADLVVLNAKNDEDEARIIAEAGRIGAVTVSTQMAGRGIDIRLGGSTVEERDEVVKLGGLYVIGAGRHFSSRIDDQLRGRAGRQGDPGGSVFFVSIEDALIVDNGEAVFSRADGDGRVTDAAVIESVAHAQRVAEGVSFEIHRSTWKYGVLIERQRQLLSERRQELLAGDAAVDLVSKGEYYDEVVEEIGAETANRAARLIALYHLDQGWSDHLAMLADVREGIHLRTLGRQSPLDEFHRAAIPAFREMMTEVETQTVDSFEESDITGEDWSPDEAGLARPAATWTYMVHDNPFGSEMERFIANASRALLGKR